MLGTTSHWFGSEFSCLPCSWLAVDNPCSSWFSRSDFWWSDFYVLFIARGWLHNLLILCSLFFFLCSLISLYFSSLVASLSGGSPFHHVCHSRFGYVFLHVCFVGLEDYFLSQTWALFFCGWLQFSPSLMLFFFFSCFPWYMCVEFVSWCFGLFYSELSGSSLAWTPCLMKIYEEKIKISFLPL